MALIGYSSTNSSPRCDNNTASFTGWRGSSTPNGSASAQSVPCKCPCSLGPGESVRIDNVMTTVYPVNDSNSGGENDD
jgi:hypothetical protein